MSWLSSWLHPDRGYKKAQEQLNNYYNQAQGQSQPYNQAGQNQIDIQNQYIQSLMHPEVLQDQWNKNYQESEAAKMDEASAQEQGIDAAGAMGLGGSNTALNAIQSGKHNIMAHDRQQYLDDLMKKYTAGAGLSQNIFNTGANTANQMGQNAMNMGQNSAQLQFGQKNAPGQRFGQIGGAGLQSLIEYLTGGMGTGSYGRGAWSPTGTGGGQWQ